MHVRISSMNYFTCPCQIFLLPSTRENSNYVRYLNVMWSGYDYPTLSEEVEHRSHLSTNAADLATSCYSHCGNVKYSNESITVSHNNTVQYLTGSIGGTLY